MLVRVSAFEVELESATITLNSLIDNLCALNGLQEGHREYYFNNESFPGFCAGVIITIKDQKHFCTLETNENGEHVIQVNGLEENNSIMDFNFFAINMDNGIGVYQHYHQSAAISALERRFKDGLKDLKDSLIAAEIAQARKDVKRKFTKKLETAIKRKHASKIKVRTLVSSKGLTELLLHYSKIQSMEYHYTTLLPKVRHATPLGNRIAKKKETITFVNPNIVKTLTKEIVEAIANYKMAKGRVFVEEADGTKDIIKIFDMPEELWERDYDEVVQMINNINVSNFEDNKFLKAMIELFDNKNYTHILRAQIE